MSESSNAPGRSTAFKDHFSGHADDYARFRPSYPAELFQWLADRSPGRGLAWDAACGNGQAAVALARHFGFVVGSDASDRQVRHAESRTAVGFCIARSERAPFTDGSLDLVTVAQAAHWFDMQAFTREVRRLLRPGGIVAAWCYALTRVAPDIDKVIDHFYDDVLGAYWPPERALIDEQYRSLHFPFPELETPGFVMKEQWSLEQFLGYLSTWSAYRRYKDSNEDPLPAVRDELEAAWGPGTREVRWPLYLRAGVVTG